MSAAVECAMSNQLYHTSPIAIMSIATHVYGLRGRKTLHSNADIVGYKFVQVDRGTMWTEEYRKNASPKPYSTFPWVLSSTSPCLVQPNAKDHPTKRRYTSSFSQLRQRLYSTVWAPYWWQLPHLWIRKYGETCAWKMVTINRCGHLQLAHKVINDTIRSMALSFVLWKRRNARSPISPFRVLLNKCASFDSLTVVWVTAGTTASSLALSSCTNNGSRFLWAILIAVWISVFFSNAGEWRKVRHTNIQSMLGHV